MYIVLFVCLYILGTKHDIFQINMSLFRQNSGISRCSTKVSETPRRCGKKFETSRQKTWQTRLWDITQKPPRFRDRTKIFRNPRFLRCHSPLLNKSPPKIGTFPPINITTRVTIIGVPLIALQSKFEQILVADKSHQLKLNRIRPYAVAFNSTKYPSNHSVVVDLHISI